MARAAGERAGPRAALSRWGRRLAFARLRSGSPGKLPLPTHDLDREIPRAVRAQVDQALSCSATGAPSTARAQLAALLQTYRPDELMVTGMIHDPQARIRSFELTAEILTDLRQDPVAA